MKTLYKIVFVTFLVISVPSVCAHLFTSVFKIENSLRESLPDIVTSLDDYIETEERRLNELECFLKDMTTLQGRLLDVLDQTEGDPTSYFKFTTFFANNWQRLEDNLNVKNTNELYDKVTEKRSELPIQEDVEGIIDGMTRSQGIFNLKTRDLANGIIAHWKSIPLTAIDCYTIAKHMYHNNVPRLSLQWMDMAMEKTENQTTLETVSMVKDFQNITTDFNMELLQSSKKLIKRLNSDAWGTIHSLAFGTAAKRAKGMLVPDGLKSPIQLKEILRLYKFDKLQYVGAEIRRNLAEYNAFERLCREQYEVYDTKKLEIMRCFYANHYNPYYKLRRLKIEVLNEQPIILVLHDITYDREIEAMKNTVLHRMERSVVRTGKVTKPSDIRISISAYLPGNDTLSRAIDRRFQSIFDLTIHDDLMEEYKISNYGTAGIFDLHIDYWQDQKMVKSRSISQTNRLFTLLTYLEKPELGGRTVFPYLDISVEPTKGSLLLFQNLAPSGYGDRRAFHGSCPVVLGSKWISSKYIHRFGQDLGVLKRLVNNAL